MFVYFIEAEGNNSIKIGKANSPLARLRDLQVGCPLKLIIKKEINCFGVSKALAIEKIAHDLLKEFSIRGEWFKVPQDELTKITKFLSLCASGNIHSYTLEDKALQMKAIAESKKRLKGQKKSRRKFGFVKSQMKSALS